MLSVYLRFSGWVEAVDGVGTRAVNPCLGVGEVRGMTSWAEEDSVPQFQVSRFEYYTCRRGRGYAYALEGHACNERKAGFEHRHEISFPVVDTSSIPSGSTQMKPSIPMYGANEVLARE